MNPIVRNILAVIAGLVIGSVVNMFFISLNGSVIPLPEGADVSTMEGLKESMSLFEPKHFIFPFLAHAIGTLVGAFIAARIAASRKMLFAMLIGVAFLAGGIINVINLPAPGWFSALDLIVAYIPMGWLGGKLGMGKSNS
ncbi:hypothetical protein SAMN06265375_10563 [Muriicola jejuensis]|uniref:Uncharacterized protein n=1 Tax=Muriicola jejuensis TaxID=504488 RepID=A0A6P0UIP9_9FLAO|nr:hypothetical protein [Muriicola jejuensis]NER11689.1 hypothetical protein [Muriicola jejuensis]SMP25429.1 hypothetical protein SAMN06265375_10563 [Muriicola jejuensis]